MSRACGTARRSLKGSAGRVDHHVRPTAWYLHPSELAPNDDCCLDYPEGVRGLNKDGSAVASGGSSAMITVPMKIASMAGSTAAAT